MSNFNEINKINKYSIKAWNVRHSIKEVLNDFHSQFTNPENIIAKGYKPDVNLEIDCNFLANTFRGVFSPEKKKEEYKITIQISHCIDNDGNLDKNELLRTLNHEYLHYLDYKANEIYSVNRTSSFSENEDLMKNEKIKNFQKGILSNNLYSDNNKYDILAFDEAIFKCLIARTFNKKLEFNAEELNILFKAHGKNFTDFMNVLEKKLFSKIDLNPYMENIFFIPNEFLKKNEEEKNIFRELFIQISNMKNIKLSKSDFYNLRNNLIDNLVYEEFNDLTGIASPFSDLRRTVLHLRNLYYTRTLDFYNENPSKNYLRVFEDKKIALHYIGQASEKLSFSGDKKADSFLREYFDLIINNNTKIKYPDEKNNDINDIFSMRVSNNIKYFINKYTSNSIYPIRTIKQPSNGNSLKSFFNLD